MSDFDGNTYQNAVQQLGNAVTWYLEGVKGEVPSGVTSSQSDLPGELKHHSDLFQPVHLFQIINYRNVTLTALDICNSHVLRLLSHFFQPSRGE